MIIIVCDVLIINKIDVLPYFDFDIGKVVEAWTNWLKQRMKEWIR